MRTGDPESGTLCAVEAAGSDTSDRSLLTHTRHFPKQSQPSQVFVLKPSKCNLDWKLAALIESTLKLHTPLLFGILILLTHTHICETVGRRLSNQTSMLTVYNWSEYICSGLTALWAFMASLTGSDEVKDYWLADKGSRKSAEQSHQMIKQTSEHAECIFGTYLMDCVCHPRF